MNDTRTTPLLSRRGLTTGLLVAGTSVPRRADAVQRRAIAPTGASYAQACEVVGARRWLHVSGQVPVEGDGPVPSTFVEQARAAWRNVLAQLRAAEFTLDDLVKVTIYLADRAYRADNARVRREVLGDRSPALTIVIVGIYDEAWLLEIEAVAAA